jgi:hypothetical protein
LALGGIGPSKPVLRQEVKGASKAQSRDDLFIERPKFGEKFWHQQGG